jgi:hypothetical protein
MLYIGADNPYDTQEDLLANVVGRPRRSRCAGAARSDAGSSSRVRSRALTCSSLLGHFGGDRRRGLGRLFQILHLLEPGGDLVPTGWH